MTSNSSPRFAVIGAGAIGSVLAWRLARAQAPVLLVGRGSHHAAIRDGGLRLTDDGGSAVHAIETCTDAQGQAARDVIVLATKAQDLASALRTARPLIGPSSVVIPAVNGLPWWYFKGHAAARQIKAVDGSGELWSGLEARQIVGAVVHWGATLAEPGHVRQAPQPHLIIGELDGSSTGRVQAIAATFFEGGLPTSVDTNIRDAVWSKLLGNIATNPLSVVTGATLDRLFNDPGLQAMVRAQMAETLAVGAACGARFEQDLDARIDIGRRLGAFRTSMLQDFDRGRPLELAAIADSVLELADAMGIPMPVTRMVVALARAAEQSQTMERKPR